MWLMESAEPAVPADISPIGDPPDPTSDLTGPPRKATDPPAQYKDSECVLLTMSKHSSLRY